VELESTLTERMEGNCEEADMESNCAKVSLSLPIVKDNNEALKTAVSNWAQDFAIGMLDPSTELDKVPENGNALEAAVQSFMTMYKEMLEEMPDSPVNYTVEITDTVLLNDGKHLTLYLDAYTFAGGAHPNPSAAVATFEVQTGKKLTVQDMVTDLEALQSMAEKKYREVKAEAFNDGFDFTPDWPFKLADNIGLTKEGIYFCYVPYEVAAYAIGFAEFTLSFEELKDILK
jgi:hypothetical protein